MTPQSHYYEQSLTLQSHYYEQSLTPQSQILRDFVSKIKGKQIVSKQQLLFNKQKMEFKKHIV